MICSDQNDHFGHNAKHPRIVTLTSGTTTISDQSTADTDVIFAGTSLNNVPTLQFLSSTLNPAPNYLSRSITVAGDPWSGTPVYGSVSLGFQSTLEVTSGVQVSDGELNFVQGIGSTLTLDGSSLIDNNGTVTDAGGGRSGGTGINIGGTLTLGQHGANVFNPSVTGVNGVVRELGKDDVVSVGAVASGFRIDARAGTFSSSSGIANFSGTIGPAAGSHAPSLGPDATVNLFLLNIQPSDIQSATFDTSAGRLSLLDASGKDLVDYHITGNARGLNLSVQNNSLVVTDHPSTPSLIPITFA